MTDNIAKYDDLLDELRMRYKRKYNKFLDDEILYIIIRLNELQLDHKRDILQVRKDIAKKPIISFNRSKDYFFYGLGQAVIYGLVLLVGLLTFIFVFYILRI